MTQLVGTFARPGPEAGLMARFVSHALPPAVRGEQRALFIEPNLDSRRPDFVAVYWRAALTKEWPAERALVTEEDMKLVQYLFLAGPSGLDALRRRFPRRFEAALRRLVEGKLVRVVGERLHPRPFEKMFATTRIISVEAKISSLGRALDQAHLNTLFSSEAYVVNPARRPTKRLAETARAWGVGLLGLHEELALHEPARTRALPRSYLSWVLNDRAWIAAHT